MADNKKYLRKRRGRWLVQVAIPDDLRERFGKANFEEYLETSSETEAKRRKHAVVAAILEKFDRARDGGPLTEHELQTQAETELRRTYDALAAEFLNSYGNLPKLAREVTEDASDPISAAYQTNRLLGKTTTDYAGEVIDRIGAENTEESVGALSEAILKAQAAAIAMLQRGMEPPPLNGRPIRRKRQGTAPKVSEVAETFITERQRDKTARLTAQTANQMRSTFRLFSNYVQDAPLS